MTDDEFWRLVLGGAIMGLIAAFREPLGKLMRRLGYRDWREK